MSSKRGHILQTQSLLRKYRQQQDVEKSLEQAGRAALLRQQVLELRSQRPGCSSGAAGPTTGSASHSSDHPSSDHCSCSCGSRREPGAEPGCFASAVAPHLESLGAGELARFLQQSGLDVAACQAGEPGSSSESSSSSSSSSSNSSSSNGQQAPERPEPGGARPGSSQQELPGSTAGGASSQLRSLARTRANAWEVRRLLAARDCRGTPDNVHRWCRALRIRHAHLLGLATAPAATTVQRARQELVLLVHPDKNPGDTELATAAFSFLQEAVEGLLLQDCS